ATWNLNPTNGEWNTASNWTPATVPDGPDDVATFGISNQTSVLVVDNVQVDKIVFEAGASAFTTTSAALPTPFAHLIMMGAGIVNNSGINQTFVAQASDGALGVGVIELHNSATAGSSTTFINSSGVFGGGTEFFESSTAGDATIINEGSPPLGQSGFLEFNDNASAGNSQIINHGGTDAVTGGGEIDFSDSSTADHATVICNGGEADGASGSIIYFFADSTAGSGNFTVNGGAGTESFRRRGLIFRPDQRWERCLYHQRWYCAKCRRRRPPVFERGYWHAGGLRRYAHR